MANPKKPKNTESPETGDAASAAIAATQGINAGSEVQATDPAANKPPEGPAAKAGDAEASASPADAKPSGMMVVVIGPKRGRWRAGRRFGPEPVSIPVEELDEAEGNALMADAQLEVTVVAAPETGPDTE